MEKPLTCAQQLQAVIRERPSNPEKIAQFLNHMDHRSRVESIRALTGAEQRVLWHTVDGFASLGLEDLVPETVPELTPVIHFGKNSLALFNHFEKRFYRYNSATNESQKELYGCNFCSMMSIIGPGYYVAMDDPDRCEVLIDYQRLPAVKPEGWPNIRSNEAWCSRFVYGFMVDRLRRISEHVTIGAAFRNGKSTDNWFILCREDRV